MARARLENDSRLRRKLRRWPESLRADLRTVMEINGKVLVNEIKARAPVDETSEGKHMRDAASYVVSRDGLSVKVGYSGGAGFKRLWKQAGFKALWQEYGTSEHPPQPFIRPAYRAKLASILNRIDNSVRRTLRRASAWGN